MSPSHPDPVAEVTAACFPVAVGTYVAAIITIVAAAADTVTVLCQELLMIVFPQTYHSTSGSISTFRLWQLPTFSITDMLSELPH